MMCLKLKGMQKVFIVLFILLSGILSKIRAQSTDSASVHVDSAMNILQTHSLYIKNLDWSKVYQDVNAA